MRQRLKHTLRQSSEAMNHGGKMLNTEVLVLNKSFQPVNVIDVKRARQSTRRRIPDV